MTETPQRTDDEILAGEVPPHRVIVLGGREYPATEPSNKRARVIRKALAALEAQTATLEENDPALLDLSEDTMDTCFRSFSPEIEADWPEIEETMTDSERIAAMAIVGHVVTAPFTTAPSATPNREARRAKRAAGR